MRKRVGLRAQLAMRAARDGGSDSLVAIPVIKARMEIMRQVRTCEVSRQGRKASGTSVGAFMEPPGCQLRRPVPLRDSRGSLASTGAVFLSCPAAELPPGPARSLRRGARALRRHVRPGSTSPKLADAGDRICSLRPPLPCCTSLREGQGRRAWCRSQRTGEYFADQAASRRQGVGQAPVPSGTNALRRHDLLTGLATLRTPRGKQRHGHRVPEPVRWQGFPPRSVRRNS